MFFDVHSHLLSKEFDTDRDRIIKECARQNVNIFETGLDYNTNNQCLRLAGRHLNVFCCMGSYPSQFFDKNVVSQIRDNVNNIIGIGEVGLDSKVPNIGVQEKTFKKMIGLAEEFGLPLIVHSRGAQKQVLDIVQTTNIPVILHAFFTSKKNITHASQLPNVFFSVPPSIVYSEQFQWLVKNVSMDRLLCETDSPYLWKKGRNTPLNVLKSYEKIAELKGLSLQEAEQIVENNVRTVFKFPKLL